MSLTCITCQVAFEDADIQRYHYKTDWHRYNLKRKVADLPPVTAQTFQLRVVNAQKAQGAGSKADGGHCQICNKHFNTANALANHTQSRKHKEMVARSQSRGEPEQVVMDTTRALVEEKNARNRQEKNRNQESSDTSPNHQMTSTSQSTGQASARSVGKASARQEQDMDTDDDDGSEGSWESWEGDALPVEVCLFCSHTSASLEKSVRHMTLEHSFFIPDLEFVCDLEGLLTYLGEKVGEGRICLWCNEKSRAFQTVRAVQQHMLDKAHCKMRHEGDAMFEYADFYDYRSSYPDYDPSADSAPSGEQEEQEEDEVETPTLEEDNYQLVLPTGAVIGHRSLQRYYRQKLRGQRQIVAKNSGALPHVMAHYRSLGWTGATGVVAQKKARDLASFHRVRSRHFTRLGVKANRLQKHFRDQVFGAG